MNVLVDTNILVYRQDCSEPAKRRVAGQTLRALFRAGAAAATPQVLAEYSVTVRRKWPERLDRATIVAEIEFLVAACDVLPLDATVSIAAAHASARYDMHFYDAQIWAAAKVHGVP
ncbi:MAG: hypothetical protein C0418_04005, partial [Coriobacteriaceae bacterium]|nr:hypothetical protein [Coriobacteriaceae bacterium]